MAPLCQTELWMGQLWPLPAGPQPLPLSWLHWYVSYLFDQFIWCEGCNMQISMTKEMYPSLISAWCWRQLVNWLSRCNKWLLNMVEPPVSRAPASMVVHLKDLKSGTLRGVCLLCCSINITQIVWFFFEICKKAFDLWFDFKFKYVVMWFFFCFVFKELRFALLPQVVSLTSWSVVRLICVVVPIWCWMKLTAC